MGTPNWLSRRLCTRVLADDRVGNRKGRQGPPRQVDVRCRGRTSAGIRHLQTEGTRNPSHYFIAKTDSFKILYLWTADMSLPLVSSPEDYIPIVHMNYLYFWLASTPNFYLYHLTTFYILYSKLWNTSISYQTRSLFGNCVSIKFLTSLDIRCFHSHFQKLIHKFSKD